ncbi:hypothetical protein V5799_008696 [Amblyomma americanum]|uniref:Uncharacterized protein n=1 Tax=Amblyomma americanum TaxID=6943 RepID=A0AAQ4FCJ7_AMBAM
MAKKGGSSEGKRGGGTCSCCRCREERRRPDALNDCGEFYGAGGALSGGGGDSICDLRWARKRRADNSAVSCRVTVTYSGRKEDDKG